MYENDDPFSKKTPQQISQSSQSSLIIVTLLSELKNQNFTDSQEILTKMTNSLTPKFDESPRTGDSPHTNVITQTAIKSTSTQFLPFLTPPFRLNVKLLRSFASHPAEFAKK